MLGCACLPLDAAPLESIGCNNGNTHTHNARKTTNFSEGMHAQNTDAGTPANT